MTAEQIEVAMIAERLREQQIDVIRFLDLPTLRYPHDGHPTGEWHELVGEQLHQQLEKW